jgi:hypothetical protein
MRRNVVAWNALNSLQISILQPVFLVSINPRGNPARTCFCFFLTLSSVFKVMTVIIALHVSRFSARSLIIPRSEQERERERDRERERERESVGRRS